jgi:hypothetical protein
MDPRWWHHDHLWRPELAVPRNATHDGGSLDGPTEKGNAAPRPVIAAAQGVQVFGLDKGMILAIPAGTITDYLTKVVALLGCLTSPLGKLDALRAFKAQGDGKYDASFPDGRLTFDTVAFDRAFTPRHRPARDERRSIM